MIRRNCLAASLGAMVVVGAVWGTSYAGSSSALGDVDFPTSGSREAQAHFLRGVAAMHSFWYEEALEAFQAAAAIQPDFAMAYWGEAMAHNHPVWREQDTSAGRAALQKVKTDAVLTPRERAYLDAVRTLYGEGEKAARDERYARAMAHVYRTYPEDTEAACFYSLALLGTSLSIDAGIHRRVQAGALASEVFHKNPNHPCAAHYTIHAFDHPDLAVLALPAARRYAQIAPASHHAQHMPAHIFLQLGMWPEAITSNENGWAVSVAWVTRKNLPAYHRDYHSLHWLHYTRLQAGQYRRAAEVLDIKRNDMRASTMETPAATPPQGWEVHRFYPAMVAEWIIETEKWDSSQSPWQVPGAPNDESAKAIALFVRGLSAVMRQEPEADAHLAALQALRKPNSDPREKYGTKLYDIWALELSAVIEAARQDYDKAIQTMKQAVALEEALPPPSGPTAVLKPTHELLGEILLKASRPKESAEQFALALQRHPKRTRSVLGAARAAVQVDDRLSASEYYLTLQDIYKDADADVPEVREAREFK